MATDEAVMTVNKMALAVIIEASLAKVTDISIPGGISSHITF
jgi:hypothetical protein